MKYELKLLIFSTIFALTIIGLIINNSIETNNKRILITEQLIYEPYTNEKCFQTLKELKYDFDTTLNKCANIKTLNENLEVKTK